MWRWENKRGRLPARSDCLSAEHLRGSDPSRDVYTLIGCRGVLAVAASDVYSSVIEKETRHRRFCFFSFGTNTNDLVGRQSRPSVRRVKEKPDQNSHMTGSSGQTNQQQALSTTEAESRAGLWLRLFLFPGSEPGQTSNSTEVFSLKTPPTSRKSQQGSSNHGSLWLFERQPLFARHQIRSCSNNKKKCVKYPAECVTFDPPGKGRGVGGSG